MSNETLTEQVKRIKAGDKVTVTMEPAFGKVYQCTGEAWEAPAGTLYVGDSLLRYSPGQLDMPGIRLVSIDAHEPVLPEITEEPTDPGVRLVDRDGDEWARVWVDETWATLPEHPCAPFTVIDAAGKAIGTVGGDRA